VKARCGDGLVRAGLETCDDGNTSDGDGCSATCQRTASTRYEVAPDGLTARDTTTGLTCQRGQSPTSMTYAAAVTSCSGLSLTVEGWRLPSGPELRGLVDATYDPAIDPVAYPNTPADLFWTSTLAP
jgi:cysteine-rich repeat protein